MVIDDEGKEACVKSDAVIGVQHHEPYYPPIEEQEQVLFHEQQYDTNVELYPAIGTRMCTC